MAAPSLRRQTLDAASAYAPRRRQRNAPRAYLGAMRLADHEALARLAARDHGILCTLHAERGVDAVPVVYVLDADVVGARGAALAGRRRHRPSFGPGRRTGRSLPSVS